MDWQKMSFDWALIRAFLATAEHGSFSAAARATDSTQPTIGRQVTSLEEDLGVVLFERVGRGLELTPTGLELVEHARAMGEAALRLSRVAAGQSLSLDGPVCISAGEVLSTHLLPPILEKLRKLYPGIQIEVISTNETSDLARREADIALRNYRPQDDELVARKVRRDEGYMYATCQYLESIGNPQTLDELTKADFIGFNHSDVFIKALARSGLHLTSSNFPWVSESQAVQWALITRGAGIGVMVGAVGDADSRVVRVLPEKLSFPFDTWLTSHREVKTSRRVRTVFDFLADALSNEA